MVTPQGPPTQARTGWGHRSCTLCVLEDGAQVGSSSRRSPSRRTLLLWPSCFPSRGSSRGLTWPFLPKEPSPQVWELLWGFSQRLGVLILIKHSGHGEVNRGWGQGHASPVGRQTRAKTRGPPGLR